MDLNKLNEIKDLIKKAEVESAKAQGIIDDIKLDWNKEFGTNDVEEIKGHLEELRLKYKKGQDKLEKLYDKLLSSYDWDKLKEELD